MMASCALSLSSSRLADVPEAVPQIVNEGFQGFLDDGGRYLFIFVGLIGGDLLRSFHGLGQIGLQFTDTGFQFFNGVRIASGKTRRSDIRPG